MSRFLAQFSGPVKYHVRLEQGRLRVLEACCPTLLAEAAQYRLDPAADYRRPLKEHDHLLDALRYLVSGIEE